MFSKKTLLGVLGAFALGGCAVQQDVMLDQAYWQSPGKSVGIVLAKAPTPTGHKVGSQGLLDLAINEGVASGSDKHLESLSISEFDEVANLLKARFEKGGMKVTMIPDRLDVASLPKATESKPNFAKKDFTSLKSQYNVDQLLVLEVVAAGTIRSYYSFFPTGAPQAYFASQATLVDLTDNHLVWYKKDEQQKPIAEPWDQPNDNYPNLTNAFYQAVESGKAALFQAAGT